MALIRFTEPPGETVVSPVPWKAQIGVAAMDTTLADLQIEFDGFEMLNVGAMRPSVPCATRRSKPRP